MSKAKPAAAQGAGPESAKAAKDIVRAAGGETYTYRGVTYGVHPLAHVFPLLSGDRLKEFEDHARANGIRDPVTLYKGDILDGRNRLNVAVKNDLDVKLVEIAPDQDLYEFVLGRNLRRRELSPSQRAMAAANLRAVSVLMSKQAQPAIGEADAKLVPSDASAASAGGASAPADKAGLAPTKDEVFRRPSEKPSAGAGPPPPKKDAGGKGGGKPFEPAPPRGSFIPGEDGDAGGGGGKAVAEVSSKKTGKFAKPVTLGEAAETMGVSERSTKRADRVRKTAPDVADAVGEGSVPLSHADRPEVLHADPEARAQAIEDVKKGGVTLPDAVAAREAERGIDPKKRKKPPKPGRKSKPSGVVDEDIDVPPLPTLSAGGPAASPAAAPPGGYRDKVPPVEVYSPDLCVRAARVAMGAIDLDPASSEEAQISVQANRFYTLAEDGVTQIWKGRVYCFPPLNAVSVFAGKLVNSVSDGAVEQAAFLAPTDTAERWAHDLLALKQMSYLVFVSVDKGLATAKPPGGGTPIWRPPTGLTLYCLGFERSVQSVETLGKIGRVLQPARA